MAVIDDLFSGTKEDHTYTAKFAGPGSIMSVFNYGFSLCGGLRATTRDISYRNALIVGPSGSGKTSCMLVGSIITLSRGKASMCVLDISGEIHNLTSGYLAKKGYKIYCINFGSHSDSFNPIALCKTIQDVMTSAYLIIKNSNIENKNDPYWTSSAEMMLSVFIQYLVFHCAPEYRSMANLILLTDMFAADPKKVDMLFVKTGDPEIVRKYKGIINVGSEKTLLSSLSTVRNAIKVFAIPELQKCTATSSFSFSDFRKEKSILYICIPTNSLGQLVSYSALLYEAMFREILSRVPEKNELSIFCLIDEMVQMRYQDLGLVFSLVRKHKAGILGIVQQEQMLDVFGATQAHSIRSNSYCKVFLSGQGITVCKNLEESIGKYTFIDEKGIERTRPLMTAAEIRMLPADKAIILAGSNPPILGTTRPYYNHWKLHTLANIPPYAPDRLPLPDPPLIPLP